MANMITQAELEALITSGAEIEVEPQVLVIQGLIEQLEKLRPTPEDNSSVVEALTLLAEKLDKTLSVTCEPIVESVNNNQIVIDTTPILEAIERLTHRCEYRFTIERNNRGQIESMEARVM